MAVFTRLKTWVSNEVLTASDLNGEFNNILNNMAPLGIEDASADVTAMQATADPGGVGTESLATTLLGEIQRLRYAIKRIVGGAQWYVAPVIDLGSTIDTADITNGAVTNIKRAAINTAVSSSSGVGAGNSSNTFLDITNLFSSITTTGKQVKIETMGDGSGNQTNLYLIRSGTQAGVAVKLQRSVAGAGVWSDITESIYTTTVGGASQVQCPFPHLNYTDSPSAGSWDYKVQGRVIVTGSSPAIVYDYSVLRVTEL